MVLEKLGESLKGTLNKISSAIFVDEKLINELVRDIQRALLGSDVNVKLVFELTNSIKQRIKGEDCPSGLSKKEFLIKIVYDELVKFVGEEPAKINTEKKPTKLMLVGLFGNGKTTTAGKLAKHYQKRGFKIGMISTDTWRPAAYEQLKQLGEQLGIPVFGNPKAESPKAIWEEFEEKLKKFDIIIVDTAGRDALSNELITELNSINESVEPDQTILVMGADVGQAAQAQAQAFHDNCKVNAVIITKMDGTAKGGGALIACAVTGAKVAFIGVGEKIDDLESFTPERFVGRLLGMGDLEGLLEKAKEAISEEDAQDLGKKLLKGDFNMMDLYEQMKAMQKLGPLGTIMDMIPGLGGAKIPKDMIKGQEEKLKKWKFMMNSFTKKELEDPEKTLNNGRFERISKGSGCSMTEVRQLFKQYKQSKKMMKMMKGKGGNMKQMQKMMSGMQGGMKF